MARAHRDLSPPAWGDGPAAGLLAGAGVGLAEALTVLSRAGAEEYAALLAGVLVYGAVGAVVGAAWATALVPLRRALARGGRPLGWASAFAATAVLLSLPLVRERVAREVFAEGEPPLSADAALLAFGVLGTVAIAFVLEVLVGRTPARLVLRRGGSAGAFATVVLLAALFSFTPAPRRVRGEPAPPRGPAGERPDVLLVVLDSVRADAADEMPALRALAREGVVFGQVVAQATWTRGAWATLLAGESPAGHGCVGAADGLPPAADTLAEAFAAAGYATGAITASPELDRTHGFDQGFDWFRRLHPRHILGVPDSVARLWAWRVLSARIRARRPPAGPEAWRPPASSIVEQALAFVRANREAGNRWLLVVHLPEAREPYVGPGGEVAERARLGPHPNRSERARLRRLYAAGLRRADEAVGALVAGLAAAGALDGAVVAVTSDHGEEFFEHGGAWHGTSLFEEQVRVPWVVRLPGGERAGTRVPWPVRQQDVAPTLAALAGVDAPGRWRGRDVLDPELLDRLEAGREEPAPALMLQHLRGRRLAGLRSARWKYVVEEGRGGRREMLYDLEADPRETEDLAGRLGAVQAAMSRRLREALEEARMHPPGPGVDCGECRRRRVLGEALDCSSVCGG